jgi:hypothetical protein
MITIKDRHGNTHYIRRDTIAHISMGKYDATVLLDKPMVTRIEVTDVDALRAALGQPMAYDAIADDLPEDGQFVTGGDAFMVHSVKGSVQLSISEDEDSDTLHSFLTPTKARTLAALLLREAAKVEAAR